MPLIAHSELPTFERLRQGGQEVLSAERAVHQDIRELHVGLLNMMPDAALQATERQFLRLIGSSNRIAQFYVHPFGVPGIPREGPAREYVDRFYEDFEAVRGEGLDALIITGANPVEPELEDEPYWDALMEVMAWASENVCSTYMSCLATHAAFLHDHGVRRVPLPAKCWGVYEHRVVDPTHPLVANINTRFYAPHSRLNDLPRTAMEAVGTRVLVDSEEAGVLAAVSPDRFRFVFFQGHPEYDANSLLKEFKREVTRFLTGERTDFPPAPHAYLGEQAQAIVAEFRDRVGRDRQAGAGAPDLIEDQLAPYLDNTWTDTGKAIFNNWLGLVYQITHIDRRVPFQPGIDPEDPLGLRQLEADVHPCMPAPAHRG